MHPDPPEAHRRDTGPARHEPSERDAEERAFAEAEPGHAGPGLQPNRGVDPTLMTSTVAIVIGFTPVAWWERLLGAGYFGPIQLPAIVAMVGVLFAFIALLRSIDLDDRRLRMQAGTLLGLGLVRLFLLPFF